MLDTNRSLYEIEVALAEYFEYLKGNIVVFNVIGCTIDIPIYHECDCLVISKSGYLTEIEIKRSWADFLNDFKKSHKKREEIIKYFFYCIPEKLLDKVYDRLDDECHKTEGFNYSGILTYDEDLNIKQHGKRYHYGNSPYTYLITALHSTKLYLEQKLAICRLGCIKTIKEKKKIIQYQNNKEILESDENNSEINTSEENELF